MSTGGKGSKPRPLSVPRKQFDDSWKRIFGKKKEKNPKQRQNCNCGMVKQHHSGLIIRNSRCNSWSRYQSVPSMVRVIDGIFTCILCFERIVRERTSQSLPSDEGIAYPSLKRRLSRRLSLGERQCGKLLILQGFLIREHSFLTY